jgi:plastocyanin
MKKLLVSLIILLVVGVIGFFVLSESNYTGNSLSKNNNNNPEKTFLLTGENFKFVMDGVDNPDIRVKQGDSVRIEFTSTQGFHDWVVDNFNAATEKVRDAEGSTFVEFIADKKGNFEYYCSVGQHRANGMKGNLIVE